MTESLLRRELAAYQVAGDLARAMRRAIEAIEQGRAPDAESILREALFDVGG